MKNLLFILLFSSSLFSQTFNQTDENGKKNGVWKGIYSESKRPRYEGMFIHGSEVGVFKFFDDTAAGTVIATREFDQKTNSCYTIFYNQKSNKVSEGKVANKQFEGLWKYYHEDSNQIMTLENYANGKLVGVRTVYYKSGKIAQETQYKNGVKDGLNKQYDENGIVLESSNFKNNEYNGAAIFRSPANVVVAKGVFVNGKKSGIWEFNSNGKITKENMSLPNRRKFAKKPLPKP